MKTARQSAFEILIKIERDKAYSTLSLKDALKGSDAEIREKSLVTLLVYGVIEKKLALDHHLSLYLKQPLKKLSPEVITVLRLGVFQLLFTDRIPANAAVNESVKLAKENRCAYASGLINAVLRKIAVSGYVEPHFDDEEKNLSIKYSFPPELVRHFSDNYGIYTAGDIMRVTSGARPVFIRVNTLKTNSHELKNEFSAQGIELKQTRLDNCFEISGSAADITVLPAFKNGYFHVQDMSSQLCAAVLDARPGETVLDCCSAPGGKAFTAAQYMKNTGRIIACDIYNQRTDLIMRGAERLGIDIIDVLCRDARDINSAVISANRVLCDVPCSGLGVIGRKPEIKYKPLESFSGLPEIQYDILSSASKAVKRGGTLVYSTCTLNPAENESVCNKFLADNPDFHICGTGVYPELCSGDFITVIPSEDEGDGFFIAKFEREID